MSASTPRRVSGAQAWSARLASVMDEPAALIAFARELQEHQDEKAMAEWRNYTLWRHHVTGKIMGVIKTGEGPREVSRWYGRDYWTCNTPFGRQVVGGTNLKLWQLRDHPDFGADAVAAYVVPKHARIWRMLREMEMGLRDKESGEVIE